MCDKTCSDPDITEIYLSEAWYYTIYPQIRFVHYKHHDPLLKNFLQLQLINFYI